MNTVIKTKPVLVQIGYLQKLNTTVAGILFGGNVMSTRKVGNGKKGRLEWLKKRVVPTSRFETILLVCIIFSSLGFLMLGLLVLEIIRYNYVNPLYVFFPIFVVLLLLLVIPNKLFFTLLLSKGKFSALLTNHGIEKNPQLSRPLLIMTKRLRESSLLFLTVTLSPFLFILTLILILVNFSISIETTVWVWLLSAFALMIWPLFLYISAARIESVLGYSREWREAKVYLLLSQKSIKKHTLEGVLLFKHSLLTLNKNLGKRKINLEPEVLPRINVMCRNPHSSKEILLKYVKGLIFAIEEFSGTPQDRERVKDKLCRSLSDFVREEKLRRDLDYWKLHETPNIFMRIKKSPILSISGLLYIILLTISQYFVQELWQISLMLGALIAGPVLMVILARSQRGDLIKVLEGKYR